MIKKIIGLFVASAALAATPVKANEREIQCLANVMFYEARAEGKQGQIAVGQVTINRRDSGRFRKTICEVVSQPRQYSWYPKPDIRDNSIRETARLIYQNKYNDITNGSLFFHSVSVNPGWRLRRTMRIGRHIFYK